ncbi:MAG: hypothetical protein IKZ96_02785 [Bacilli bacterium]|nr:hypothetical protein [Bacilli bacterium]
MKLENLNGRPIDYIEDESAENRGLYSNPSNDVTLDQINSLDSVEVISNSIEDKIEALKQYKKEVEEFKSQLSDEDLSAASQINDEFRDRAKNALGDIESLFEDSPNRNL